MNPDVQFFFQKDSPWQKEEQEIVPYTNIHEKLIPKLKEVGFTVDDINQLISVNPAKAFAIRVRKT